MPLWVPSGNDYRWQLSTTTGRPASAFGTSITPSGTANTYTSYTQLIAGSSVVHDVWAIMLNFNTIGASASAREMIATIGIDPAGGTSYTDLIPDLLVSEACGYTVLGGGVWYYFPIFIPAGSSIGCKVSQTLTTTTAIRAWATLYGQPARPETTRVGYWVEAIGKAAGASRGTTITEGTTSEGSWTLLGTTTKAGWWWQVGLGANSTSMSNTVRHVDLAADSAGSKILIADTPVMSNSTEQISNLPVTAGCTANVGEGVSIYGRAQSAGTAVTGTNLMAYVLGG